MTARRAREIGTANGRFEHKGTKETKRPKMGPYRSGGGMAAAAGDFTFAGKKAVVTMWEAKGGFCSRILMEWRADHYSDLMYTISGRHCQEPGRKYLPRGFRFFAPRSH